MRIVIILSLLLRFINISQLSALALVVATLPAMSKDKRTLAFAFSDGSPPLSYGVNNQCQGILHDLLRNVVEEELQYKFECTPLPWKRAQLTVKHYEYDGLSTYPSKSRKEYAYFTTVPIYKLDFGYLVYNKNKPEINGIKKVKSYSDLAKFKFLGVIGVGWEKDNVPAIISRELAPNMRIAFNLLLRREIGDFMIVSPEQANFMATSFGFDARQLGFVRAEFITNRIVPFHVGIQKLVPGAKKIVDKIDLVLQSTKFKNNSALILKSYFAANKKDP